MSNNDNDISSLSHSKWRCHYHVVFAPKFRRQAIYGKIKTDIGKILRQLCEQKGIEIIEAELCPDHVHMLLAIPYPAGRAGSIFWTVIHDRCSYRCTLHSHVRRHNAHTKQCTDVQWDKAHKLYHCRCSIRRHGDGD